jgi:hypothetical protein
MENVRRHGYATLFSDLGYCFWDNDRLKGWGKMFAKDWYQVEVEKACRKDTVSMNNYGMLLPGGHLWIQYRNMMWSVD